MATTLPTITFHAADTGLTVELTVKREINKNVKFFIDNTVNPSADGSYTLCTKESLNATLKDLVAEINRQWNANFENLVVEIITDQWNDVMSPEVDKRIGILKKQIVNDRDNFYNNDYPVDSATTDGYLVSLRKTIETAIANEQRTREDNDNALNTKIEELLPPGFMMPVLHSMNGKPATLPSYISKNFVKCDGSKFTSAQYPKLAEILYPSGGNIGTDISYLIRDNFYKKMGSESYQYIPRDFVMEKDDFDDLVGFDCIDYFAYHRNSSYNEGKCLSYTGTKSTCNIRVSCPSNRGAYFELYADRAQDDSTTYSASDSTTSNSNYTKYSRGTIYYIQVYNHGTRSLIKSLVYCNITDTFTATAVSSNTITGINNELKKIYPNITVLSSDESGYQNLLNINFASSEVYITITPAPCESWVDLSGFVSGKWKGRVDGRILMNDGPAGRWRWSPGTTGYLTQLGRFVATVDMFANMVSMNPEDIRNQFIARGTKSSLTIPSTNKVRYVIRPGTNSGSIEFYSGASAYPLAYETWLNGLMNGKMFYIRWEDENFNVVCERIFYSRSTDAYTDTNTSGLGIGNYNKVKGYDIAQHVGTGDFDSGDLMTFTSRKMLVVHVFVLPYDTILERGIRYKKSVHNLSSYFNYTYWASCFGAYRSYPYNNSTWYSRGSTANKIRGGLDRWMRMTYESFKSLTAYVANSSQSTSSSTNENKYGTVPTCRQIEDWGGTVYTYACSPTGQTTHAHVYIYDKTDGIKFRLYHYNNGSWYSTLTSSLLSYSGSGVFAFIIYITKNSTYASGGEIVREPVVFILNRTAKTTNWISETSTRFTNTFTDYTSTNPTGDLNDTKWKEWNTFSSCTLYFNIRVVNLGSSYNYQYATFSEDTDMYLPDMTEEGTFIGGGTDVGGFKGWTIPNPGGSFYTQGWSSSASRTFKLGGSGRHLTASYGEASVHQEFIYDPSMVYSGYKWSATKSYPDHFTASFFIKIK